MKTMLKLQLSSIRVSFQKSISSIEHQYNTLLYSRLHRFISRQCIQHIGKELERVKFVGSDKAACVNLQVLKYKVEPIPRELTHVFWKKLYIEEHEVTHRIDSCVLEEIIH